LPYDLLIKLKPAPKEYSYVKVDDNVLLIAEASKKIIDAVDILSTLNR
jgi:Ni/Co efflux regulator RcnB